MEFRQLGRSGFKVPALGLGTATFGGGNEFFKAWGSTGADEASRLVDMCLEAGLNLFDSADIYSDGIAEEVLGKAIAGKRGKPIPQVSRLHSTKEAGPPVTEEFLFDVVDELLKLSEETGKTVPQIALNWLLQKPTVSSVIIGARNEEQLRQNLDAVGWNLTPEQVKKLDEVSTRVLPYPYWHQAQFQSERIGE